MATFPTGSTGYIESPIIAARPSHYGKSDLYTLFHSVVHTYYPEITEPSIFRYIYKYIATNKQFF